MLDEVDHRIIQILKENSRLTWKEIGEKVYLTGQAVGARIRRLEEAGVIRSYTVDLDYKKLDSPITALVTVIMKTENHGAFRAFVKSRENISEAYRISGTGCYWLKIRERDQESLNSLLDEILAYGNYSISLVIDNLMSP